ncbi:DegT/DnrJ/EryC1/StrS family aminotransferase [Xanthomarina sp. F1114]|uniref:DegT/DnrJ/EryC1/StrS family aminotransferase n=1 Tax=Xanthomarina sp. F1114 TaxID=2996019 RepID=UPI00225DCE2A|nr:DegT/DnrJ/EryC1/StrS family aminotransferase [Xanthomarina sp. F1114]MCX7547123.1 DegT/DnrJ/EryC1/StrS family aminotransferase [Xanthomarina sp. F1114]
MIYVTKTFLPKQEDYSALLKKSWDKHWITNRGDLVLELEQNIKETFKIPHMIATTNGTLPLQIAIKALGLTGEILTTPFSYIATSSAIAWEGCKPVFVDIDADSFNIDPAKIEAKITSKTTGILATHVFGNPCEMDAIDLIAKKHNLKVIYDAAHCFGVEYQGKSIFNFGDVSTCSFHATKIFHTGEGGAMFTTNSELYKTLYYQHNFGHNGPEDFYGMGINAKMSELQAAMGLAVFPHFFEILKRRHRLYNVYIENLKVLNQLQFQKITKDASYNCAYFPVVFPSENDLLHAKDNLSEASIFPRRYFYPSLNTIPYLNGEAMPISESLSKRILCLPLYYDLKEEDVLQICRVIHKSLN